MLTWGVTYAGESTSRSDAADGLSVQRNDQGILPALSGQLTNQSDDPAQEIPRRVEQSCSGIARRLVVPGEEPAITAIDLSVQFPVTTATELPEGEYLLECRGGLSSGSEGTRTTYVLFEGPASLKPEDGTAVLSFWEPTEVTVGTGGTNQVEPAQITVEPTPEGLAAGLSHLSAAHHTDAPSRSHPGFRDHPPLLEVGEETNIPSSVRDETPETGIEFHLPASMDALFVAAPLAYYLGAEVRTGEREAPRLTFRDGAVDYQFDALPEFQHQCAQLLRRTFYLDCLSRRVSPEQDHVTPQLLDRLSLELDDVRSLSPAGRLERYLDVAVRDLDAALPDWHLSTYASPSADRARCLPFLLDRLSLVYLPQASELDTSDLLDRTLAESYTTRGRGRDTKVVQPELQAGRVHAWLAPGTPIDAFKTTPTAFENRYKFRHRQNDQLQFAVVLNDAEMSDEHATVADIYKRRASDLPIDVTVYDRLPRAELAELFEAEHDFVHYIGHCEEEGLRCPDGNLAVSDIDESRTRTFFLNACGSYDEGLELVEQGSIAGGVTFTDVLDSHAAKVGTAFARLLVHGFSIERALQLARRRIVMGKDYAVVGDGTYALLPSPREPAVLWIEDDEAGYHLSCEVLTARSNGEQYRLPFDDHAILNGSTTEATIPESELEHVLSGTSVPVIYDGDFHWSDELASSL